MTVKAINPAELFNRLSIQQSKQYILRRQCQTGVGKACAEGGIAAYEDAKNLIKEMMGENVRSKVKLHP